MMRRYRFCEEVSMRLFAKTTDGYRAVSCTGSRQLSINENQSGILLKIIDCLTDCLNLLSLLIRDVDVKFLFKLHNQLHRVQ